jgi:hypothetical protein
VLEPSGTERSQRKEMERPFLGLVLKKQDLYDKNPTTSNKEKKKEEQV